MSDPRPNRYPLIDVPGGSPAPRSGEEQAAFDAGISGDPNLWTNDAHLSQQWCHGVEMAIELNRESRSMIRRCNSY
jgi:hypothetical protein